MRHSKNIIFFIPYPVGEAPSQRFRFEQYLKLLDDNGFKITLLSFYNQSTWKVLYKEGNSFLKFTQILKAYFLHLCNLYKVKTADFVFIHREIVPVGPPILEWIIAKLFQKKIIYDFDDAIWRTDKQDESFFERALRWRSKVAAICTWSHKVSCGNKYLAAYAQQFNKNVVVNPTTIDTQDLHNPSHLTNHKTSEGIVIGWTGSHSTLKYLYEIEPVIERLEIKYPTLRFVVIANRKPEMKLKSLRFMPWSLASEIQDLSLFDIGVMPLPDDEWSKGKCGFKALQYMALGIPAVVSPVGVNNELIDNNVNGFLCSTPSEWFNVLSSLIENFGLRKKIGIQARQKVISHYSVESNSAKFLSLFQ